MSDWFDELHGNRLTWLESTRQNDFEQGIKNLTVDKYTEPVHFIYELLQNAEDQDATSVHFILTNNYLEFCHNGKSFQQADVVSITGIGNTQKASQGNKIGCFGIGFKSVFEITERPEIYAILDGKPFAFAIEDQVVPVCLPVKKEDFKEGQTRFILPFKSGTERYYDQIREKLRLLGADTLLFLDHLTAIHWKTETEKGVYQSKRSQPPNEWCDLISEERTSNESVICQETRYLRFSKAAHVIGSNSELAVQIAFRVENDCVEPEKDLSVLNVFFPTREQTGLKFRLHAPMLLNDSRTNIKRDNKTNIQLMQDCATLLAESLSHLKEAGLLNAECLNCLPIREESFPIGSPFRPLYDAVRTALRTQPLLPTARGSSQGHVQPDNAKISESSTVRTLLNEGQLTQLHRQVANTTCWLSEKIRKLATKDLWHYIQHELDVKEIDLEEFAGMVDSAFLRKQPDLWIGQFYEALLDAPSLWAKERSNPRLRRKEIIRLEDDSHVAPFNSEDKPNAFLPINADIELPTVKRSIAQDENALRFLRNLGLAQPDTTDIVLKTVLPKFAELKTFNKQIYTNDLAMIADAINSVRPERRSDLDSALRKTMFIIAFNSATQKSYWKQPKDVYQSTPDLIEWFKDNADSYFVPDWLEQQIAWQTTLSFLNRQSCLVQSRVRFVHLGERDKDNNVIVREDRGNYVRGLNGFDPYAKVDGLEQALRNITIEKAQTLWRILLDYHHLKGWVEQATYKDWRNSTKDHKASYLYEQCTRYPWLPDNSGKFHLPSDISLFDLPKTFDSHSEKAKQLADGLDMKRVDALEKEREDRLIAEYKRNRDEFLAQKREKVALPAAGNDITSTRAEKVRQAQLDSPDVKYETLPRSVRTSSSKLRDQDRQYLMDYCTNVDGQVVCQICESKMPFKVNGYDYFEAVQFWRGGKKEIIYNRMALCPVCAAKWLYANNHTPEELRAKLLACQPGENLTITLAGEPAKLTFFSRQHLGSLKLLLQDD